MNTVLRNLPVLCVAAALTACSTVTVSTDYDHATSFGKYRTYTLAPAAHGQTLSATSEAALRGALRRELSARGIHEVTGGKSDLAIVRHVFLQEKVSTRQYTDWGYGYGGAWPYRYGHYAMWTGAPQTYIDVTHYTEGTMILDFVDNHTKKLVFRGTGEAVVGGPEQNAGKIQDAVAKIVAGLPTGKAQ